jgi:hypothetical protein
MLRIRDGIKNLGSFSKRLASAASQSCGAVAPRHVELLLNYVDSQHPEHLCRPRRTTYGASHIDASAPPLPAKQPCPAARVRGSLLITSRKQSTFTPTSFMPQRVPNRST